MEIQSSLDLQEWSRKDGSAAQFGNEVTFRSSSVQDGLYLRVSVAIE